MKGLENKGAINIYREIGDKMDVVVEGTRACQLEKMLRDRNIRYTIAISDTATMASPPIVPIKSLRTSPVSSSRSRPTGKTNTNTFDWNDYYPLNVIYSFMDDLESEFPSICTVEVIGKSVEGRDIKLLKISNSVARNTGIWLDGAIHAREWISVSVVTYIADYVARNFNKLPANMTNKDWYFVPVLNPDGYVYSCTTDRMWRKSRAKFASTVCGVDLNRNFESIFHGEEHTSDDPNHINYKGPEPFSEPETAAMKDFILYSTTPFKVFLTFHAYSEVIAFPWCNTKEPCPDYVTLLEGAAVMAKAIFRTTGRMYKVGGFTDIMYNATGTSIDWSYGKARIPFSYLVELRSKQNKFLLPKDEILDCCREVLNAVIALTEHVDKYTAEKCVVFAKRR